MVTATPHIRTKAMRAERIQEELSWPRDNIFLEIAPGSFMALFKSGITDFMSFAMKIPAGFAAGNIYHTIYTLADVEGGLVKARYCIPMHKREAYRGYGDGESSGPREFVLVNYAMLRALRESIERFLEAPACPNCGAEMVDTYDDFHCQSCGVSLPLLR